MARYKDIDAIIEQMNGSTAENWGKGLGRSWWSHSVMLKDNIVQLMKDAPEADVVEVVHGEWKYIQMDDFRLYKVICPFCKAEYVGNYDAYIEPEDFNYCPNCGVRMDGDEDDL